MCLGVLCKVAWVSMDAFRILCMKCKGWFDTWSLKYLRAVHVECFRIWLFLQVLYEMGWILMDVFWNIAWKSRVDMMRSKILTMCFFYKCYQRAKTDGNCL